MCPGNEGRMKSSISALRFSQRLSGRNQRTWPHLVMRGAAGGERQIGQVVSPPAASLGTDEVVPTTEKAEERGTST